MPSPEATVPADPTGVAAVLPADGIAEDGDDRGPSRVAEALARGRRFVVDGPEPAAVERHRVEHREPSIWFWRRTVGAAFAFILVTLTWYLIKLPDGLIGDEVLPDQTQVASAFNEVRGDGFAGATLRGHAGASLLRLVAGLVLGTVVGLGVGLVAGAGPLARTVIDPIISFFRVVPGVAIAPLLLLWFGGGERVIVAVVAFSTAGLAMAAASDWRAATLREAGGEVTSSTIDGLRAVLLHGWATALAIETITVETGLGSMIWAAQGRSDIIVVGIYTAGLLGFVLDTAVRAVGYLIGQRRGGGAMVDGLVSSGASDGSP